MNICYEVFCKFLGDFWEEIVGFVKFREIRNLKRFSEVLKLEFVVNN